MEIMSIQTPIGVFTPTCILQGSTDAGNHFQSVTSNSFDEIGDNLLQYLDDFLLHAVDETNLLSFIEFFFEICQQKGFKRQVEKSLFSAARRHSVVEF